MDYVVKNLFKTKIRSGVDAKLLQYETNIRTICDKKINLKNLLADLFKTEVKCNCIMINLEKDKDRYTNTVNELNKISIDNFVHLKGTYWKNKEIMENDLTFIIEFLSQFNQINPKKISIDEFSEINDENIHIQDGPLGCYCSHLRALIYGYLNFEKYTIVVEDDIIISNTEYIETYLKQIPDDWDIICLNAVGKNKIYDGPYYKFTDCFHSTHFYIVNHKCMETLFKHMYPIDDQVDVLISNLINKINIYNIPNTVYQKCISTNTQNNLHTIFTAKYYDVLREQLEIIKKSCMFFANLLLPDNQCRNETIISNLLYDVVYSYIVNSDQSSIDELNKDDTDYTKDYINMEQYDELFFSLAYFIQCSKKAINVPIIVCGLINDIFGVLKKFILHNTIDKQFNEIIKAYNYGATSQTYILEHNKIIIKAYNDKLRWTIKDHNDSDVIFEKELNILNKNILCGPKLICFDKKFKIIKMTYCGESLYNSFILPDDWEKQIEEIFNILTQNNIFYPEFKIQNILNLNGKITFIDYGLALDSINVDNSVNCTKFIKLLSLLNEKFSNILDKESRYQLYSTFINNMKMTDIFKHH